MGFYQFVHAFGYHAYRHGILHDDIFGCTDEEVGFTSYPFGAGLGLDTLRDIHVVTITP